MLVLLATGIGCLATVANEVSRFLQATVCKNDTDCGSGECCYIEPEFIVVSRRQLVLPDQPNNKRDTGTGFVCFVFPACPYCVQAKWQ